MISIQCLNVYPWDAMIRGLRNPLESWEKSDSCPLTHYLGSNDYKLMKNLWKAGHSDRKFLRFMVVDLDIIAPLYWWKEYDTYKIGTVANSCSTMHCVMKKKFTADNFSFDQIPKDSIYFPTETIDTLNVLREKWMACNDPAEKKKIWYILIQLLPSSFNQKRTVQLNYEVLAHMYNDRRNHKLDEWRNFLRFMEVNLPYSEFITGKFEE